MINDKKKYSKTPLTARLLLTGKCNLDCPFCLTDATKGGKGAELSTEEWFTFFEKLKQLRIFNLILSGGELFLRDDIFALLKKLRDNKMHRIFIFSNGTLIGQDAAIRLRRLKINKISVSLDGLKEKNDALRGKGSFDKAITGIKNLLAENIFPQISITPTQTNYKEIGPLIELTAEMGIRRFQVNSLSPEGRCMKIFKKFVPGPSEEKEIIGAVDEIRGRRPELRVDCQLGFYLHLSRSYEFFVDNPENYELKYLKEGCGAAKNSFTVTANGDIIPCEGLSSFIGGNIRADDLMDVWNHSGQFEKIRQLAGIPLDQTPHCGECKYIYICNGGCRGAAYIVYNDLLAPSPLCPFWSGDELAPTAKKHSSGAYL